MFAVQVTVVMPTANVEPDAGVQVTTGAGEPVADGAENVTTGLQVTMADGHDPITAADWTLTVALPVKPPATAVQLLSESMFSV